MCVCECVYVCVCVCVFMYVCVYVCVYIHNRWEEVRGERWPAVGFEGSEGDTLLHLAARYHALVA